MRNRASIAVRGTASFYTPICLEFFCGSLFLLFGFYLGRLHKVKRPRSETDHSHPSTAKVKNE